MTTTSSVASSSRLFLRPGADELPLDSARLFGREAPLVVEIGFGNGWFLEYLGESYPQFNVLGVELSVSSTGRAYKRLLRHRLPNVIMYRGDGRFLMRDALPDRSVSRIYVNFPDPWPRRKHRDRRLLQSGFFNLAATKLQRDGSLVLTTDHPEYFDFARGQARNSGAFREEITNPDAALLQTRYAKKWLKQQKDIFHVRFHRVDDRPSQPPVITLLSQELLMQHALMTGDLSGITDFEKHVHLLDWGQIVMRDMYRSSDGSRLVFTVLVEEPGLKQDILIEAEPRPNGVFVGIQKFGSPLVTHGLGEAVRLVTEWLAERGLTVVKTWY